MEKKKFSCEAKIEDFFKERRKSSHFDASANIEIFKMIAHFEWRNERKIFFIGMKIASVCVPIYISNVYF